MSNEVYDYTVGMIQHICYRGSQLIKRAKQGDPDIVLALQQINPEYKDEQFKALYTLGTSNLSPFSHLSYNQVTTLLFSGHIMESRLSKFLHAYPSGGTSMLREHASLAHMINHLVVPPGQIALWSLGQAGFVIKGGSTILCIDPYLSNSITEQGGPARRYPPPLDPTSLTNVQIVLTTHEHLDHTDPATLVPLLSASEQAMLVTSPQGREMAQSAGISANRIHVPPIGQRTANGDLVYTAVPAAHYTYEVDAQQQARWMGFLIELNGLTLYHAGDTVVIPELLTALAGVSLDLALLPINGRDYFREEQDIVGNLWPGEAMRLAQRFAPRVLIGMHNDLFAANRVRSGLLFDELDNISPFQRCHLLQPGELYLYAG